MTRVRLLPVLVGGLVLSVAGGLPGSISPAAGDDDRPPAQQSGGGSLPGVKTPVPPGADGAVNPEPTPHLSLARPSSTSTHEPGDRWRRAS